MTVRRRPKSSGPAGRARQPVPVNKEAVAPRKRARPPLIEQFHVAVDGQLKSGYGTYEAAERAAREIKEQYPKLQVTVFDAKEQQHTTIKQPNTRADPHKKSSRRVRRMTSQGRAVAGGRR